MLVRAFVCLSNQLLSEKSGRLYNELGWLRRKFTVSLGQWTAVTQNGCSFWLRVEIYMETKTIGRAFVYQSGAIVVGCG